MPSNAAVAETFSDVLAELGGIPSERVHREPTPGRATIDDLVRANDNGSLCELVDGTLVEKAMGWRESLIAVVLSSMLRDFVRVNNLGVVTGADGFVQLLGSLVRGPDVTFVSWDRMPGGQITRRRDTADCARLGGGSHQSWQHVDGDVSQTARVLSRRAFGWFGWSTRASVPWRSIRASTTMRFSTRTKFSADTTCCQDLRFRLQMSSPNSIDNRLKTDLLVGRRPWKAIVRD